MKQSALVISVIFLNVLTLQADVPEGWRRMESKDELYYFYAPQTNGMHVDPGGLYSLKSINFPDGCGPADAFGMLILTRTPRQSDHLDSYRILKQERRSGIHDYEVETILLDYESPARGDDTLSVKKFIFTGQSGDATADCPTIYPVQVALYVAQNPRSGWTYYIWMEVVRTLPQEEQQQAWELMGGVINTFHFYNTPPEPSQGSKTGE